MRAETIAAVLGGAWVLKKVMEDQGAPSVGSSGDDAVEARGIYVSPHQVQGIPVSKSGETGPGRWKVTRVVGDPALGAIVWRWDALNLDDLSRGEGFEDDREKAIGAAQSWLLGGVSD